MRASAALSSSTGPSAHVVNAIPDATGMQLWNTIAPIMFPSASVSLPWLTHRTLFSFSGSSVAIGAITSASSVALALELLGDADNLTYKEPSARYYKEY